MAGDVQYSAYLCCCDISCCGLQ